MSRIDRKLQGPTTILPNVDFDRLDPRTTPIEQVKAAVDLREKMSKIGFDLVDLHTKATKAQKETLPRKDVVELVSRFHDTATVLFLQWKYSHDRGDNLFSGKKNRTTEFAAARMYNELTRAVRGIDKKYHIFDKQHIEDLKGRLRTDIQTETRNRNQDASDYNPRAVGEALAKAAADRTHEKAWAWTVLPTFPKQHYGRILIDMVDLNGIQAFITQPTFSDKKPTLLHTHGQNWAWSVPLGNPGSGENRHLNTLWKPNSRDNLFPLERMSRRRKKGFAYYSAGDVAVIPPKTIHGIEGSRLHSKGMTIEEFGSLSAKKKQEVLEKTKFGEQSCLHIYRGDTKSVEDFKINPVEFIPGKPQGDLFEQIDMIVFDDTVKPPQAWAGGGGAWTHRLMTHGREGDHCGECFKEKDNRMEQLPHKVVYDRFIDPTFPGLILYPASEFATPKRRK